jgi:hypothetical protein
MRSNQANLWVVTNANALKRHGTPRVRMLMPLMVFPGVGSATLASLVLRVIQQIV